MRKRLQVLFLITNIFIFLKSQTVENIYEYIPKVASPEMANLGKFIETPVSVNTGIPTIDVPLMNVGSGSYDLPIMLNYHAGGVKVFDVASWVGLGWKLSTDGVIMRQQRGNPDEFYFFNQNSVIDYNNTEPNNQILKRNNYLQLGTGDYEADIFTISFGNISGKFFFHQASQEFIDGTGEKLKISFKPDGTENYWEIIDSKGTTYYFRHQVGEKTESYFSRNGLMTFEETDRLKGIDLWRITKIKTKEGKEINFEYKNVPGSNSYYLPGITKKDVNISSYFGNLAPCNFSAPDLFIKQYNQEFSYALEKINFDNGYVKFLWSDNVRPDSDNQYAVKSIELYNLANKLIKKFILSYENIASAPANGVETKYRYRMYLNQIDFVDIEDQQVKKLYRGFSYLNRESLPNRLSTARDHWGGFNNINNDNNKLIQEGIYKFNASGGSVKKIFVNGGDRKVDSIHVMDGILNKIILPTKGEIKFTYENNRVKSDSVSQEIKTYFSVIDTNNLSFSKSYAEFVYPGNILKYQTKITIPVNNYKVNPTIYISGDGCNSNNPSGLQCDFILYVFPDNNTIPNSLSGGTLLSQAIFEPGKKYIIAAHPNNGDDSSSDFNVDFELINEIVPRDYLIGGIRIKKIELIDGETQIEKSYDYNHFGTNISSGKIQKTPTYARMFIQLKNVVTQ